MKGNTTYIKDPSNPAEEPKSFNFDFSYWSHDSFSERADGCLRAFSMPPLSRPSDLVPSSDKYADQV